MPTVFDSTLFSPDWDTDWHMQGGERAALLYLLGMLKPRVSIEIGTFRGGSLRPISHYSGTTYTFDIDPMQHRMAPSFPQVHFVTGDTAITLPPIIDAINDNREDLGFVLVDGSHETDGVRHDIDCCLRYVPQSGPYVLVMHDSANPAVRKGILSAGWQDCPYTHALDLDFVPGSLYPRNDIRNQLWGGLAVGLLLPTRRDGPLEMRSNFAYTLEVLSRALTAGIASS